MVLKSTRTIAKFSILMDPPRAAIIQCLRNQRPNQLDCLGVSATTTGVKFEGKGGSTQEGHLAQHKSSTAWHQATWPTRTADFSPLLSGKKNQPCIRHNSRLGSDHLSKAVFVQTHNNIEID
jgi:hypothetical protein